MQKHVTIRSYDYSATVSTVGANCISFIYDSRRVGRITIIRPPENEKDERSFLFGIPLLFPPNRIDGGNFTFEGRRYSFPISDDKTECSLHGNLNEEEFQIIEQGENFVSLALKKDYFGNVFQPFSIIVNYSLSVDGLKQTVTINNDSDKNFPLAIGFHTSFNIPFFSGENSKKIRFTAKVKNEVERNSRYLPTGKRFSIKNDSITLNLSDPISKVCEASDKGEMIFTDEKENLSITYRPDEKFLYRVLFNGGAKNFFCAEVQTCNVNACKTQSQKDGFGFIPPTKSQTFVSYISLRDSQK